MRSVEDAADLIPTADVADILGKSVPTVNRYAAEGRLVPAIRMPGLRGARLYRRSDVEAFAAAETEPATA